MGRLKYLLRGGYRTDTWASASRGSGYMTLNIKDTHRYSVNAVNTSSANAIHMYYVNTIGRDCSNSG